MNIPKVKFSVLSFEDNVEIVAGSLTCTTGPLPIAEYTYNLFPQLRGKVNETMEFEEIMEIVKNNIKEDYDNNLNKMNDAATNYQEYWDKYNDEFMIDLSKVLNINWSEDDKIIQGEVGLIPICPRYLRERIFDMTIDTKHDDVIETVAHECCHFLFFDKWKQLFKDWQWEHFDAPYISWYLSEMVVDPILNKTSLHTKHNIPFKGYSSFYDIELDNENMMNKLKNIYNENDIEDAITLSYKYVLKNEKEIKDGSDK